MRLVGCRTPYDTPAVIKYRKEVSRAAKTHEIKTLGREILRTTIQSKCYDPGAAKRERKAFIVIGPPAAGKSSMIVKPLAEKHGALVIDPDVAKEFIPEYRSGKFAGVVHEESSDITLRVLAQAVQNGENIVIASVGKTLSKIRDFKDVLRVHGYQVCLVLLHLDPGEAAKRVVTRLDEEGRFVDPCYVLYEVGYKPRQNFDILKKEANWACCEAWSNDVERGQPPRLLERFPSDHA